MTNYLLAEVAAFDYNSKNLVDIKYLGKFKNTPLFSLRIFPVRYDQNKSEIVFLTELEVEISLTSFSSKTGIVQAPPNFLEKSLLNTSGIFAADKVPVQKASSANEGYPNNPALFMFNRFKIGVKEAGIYKITYQDLDDAGFPVDRISSFSIKLFNRGYEVPINFFGEEDGTFDDGDYIEFWGEANEKTFFHKYKDLY